MDMKNLIRYRKKMGMTQQDLAEKSGYSRSSIINWETGKRAPRTVDIEKLAEALNTTADYLLKGEPFEPEPPAQETPQSQPVNNLPSEPENNLGLGYWGSVADNARKVAARGDKREMALITPLLRSALEAMSADETEGEKRKVNQVIFGGRENKNEFNA